MQDAYLDRVELVETQHQEGCGALQPVLQDMRIGCQGFIRQPEQPISIGHTGALQESLVPVVEQSQLPVADLATGGSGGADLF